MAAQDKEFEDYVAEAKAHLVALSTDTPELIEGLRFAAPSSYQAATLRELLRHRMFDLAEVAIPLLEQGRAVPAAILARAAAETTALTFALHRQVTLFLSQHDHERFRAFLSTALVGSRNPEHPVQAVNILNHIDRLTEEFPAFRKSYDALSEFAHPNWSGVLGAYGTIDHDNLCVSLGKRDNGNGLLAAALVTSSVLDKFCHYYDLLADALAAFDSHVLSRESAGDA